MTGAPERKRPAWLRPLLFTLGGMAAGWLYYRFVGCASGTCPITATPLRAMLYLGFMGWLLSVVFSPTCPGSCNR